MSNRITSQSLDQIFLAARTHNVWLDTDVPDALLHELVDIVKMGPTSANCLPARFLFVKSKEAKQRLEPHLSGNNREKSMKAPVCAIIGHDLEFHRHMSKTFAHNKSMAEGFAKDEELARETAFRNGTLQGAYLILAARALGLDTGPMSGFDNEAVDKEFFAGTSIRSNFLCNLGYGDATKLFPRLPRLEFAEMATIL
ncbi:MAG: malonic semialdehyde reductase [Pseudomonadota bacterium]|nr:malonic semialdehyde reductase [Pseudomonadota bacterium]